MRKFIPLLLLAALLAACGLKGPLYVPATKPAASTPPAAAPAAEEQPGDKKNPAAAPAPK